MERRPTRIAGLLCILFASLALYATTARAQGLVQADVLPVLGDSWHMRALQTVPSQPPLTHDMLWEYGGLTGNDLFGATYTVVAPATVAGSAAYEDANRAIRTNPDDGSAATHGFYQVTAARCLDLGTLGQASSTHYQPGALAHAYPLELGEHVDNTFCYSVITVEDTMDYCGTTRIEIVATGTLVLSYDTFHDVQLMRTRKASALADDGTDSTITIIHDWYAPGIPYPLLHFTQYINAAGGSTRSGQILDEASLVGIAETRRGTPLPVFPNPATETLTFQCDSPGQLDLFGADGRAVRSIAVNAVGQRTLGVGDLPEGIYHLVFRGTGPLRSAKVVVVH